MRVGRQGVGRQGVGSWELGVGEVFTPALPLSVSPTQKVQVLKK
jgi:hypothetical protein